MITICIPDLHCPFEHPDAFKFLRAVKKLYKPNTCVILGDEIDAHALGDYDHDPDGLSAGDELIAAIKHLQPLYELFPNALVCESNHTSRPYRQAYKHGIPRAMMRDYSELLKAPKGWCWMAMHEVDGVLFEHGESFTGQLAAIKSAQANMQSTVIGHIHAFAGIQFSANEKSTIFGFNVGCLIDRKAYAFAYGRKIKAKPVLGCGIIADGVPLFVPMTLDRKGRWTRKL